MDLAGAIRSAGIVSNPEFELFLNSWVRDEALSLSPLNFKNLFPIFADQKTTDFNHQGFFYASLQGMAG